MEMLVNKSKSNDESNSAERDGRNSDGNYHVNCARCRRNCSAYAYCSRSNEYSVESGETGFGSISFNLGIL